MSINEKEILIRRIKNKALLQNDSYLQNESVIRHLLDAKPNDINADFKATHEILKTLVLAKDKASLSNKG